MPKKDEEPARVTSEKPVSLNPLGLGEALKALLQVKPKPEEKKRKKEDNTKTKNRTNILEK